MLKRLLAVGALVSLAGLGASSVSSVPQTEVVEPVREIKNCVNGDSLPEGKCVRAEDYETEREVLEAVEALTGPDLPVDERFEFIESDIGR